MATLPIPQVDTPAYARADSEPGVGPVPSPSPASKKMVRKPAFRTPVFPRPQNEAGITYAMVLPSETGLTPTVPVAVRSSLAQTIMVFRAQVSHYISQVRPGPVPMDYPVAKVRTLINTAPANRSRRATPVPGRKGFPARSGYMSAPPRFRKALRAPVNDYNPPVYGG